MSTVTGSWRVRALVLVAVVGLVVFLSTSTTAFSGSQTKTPRRPDAGGEACPQCPLPPLCPPPAPANGATSDAQSPQSPVWRPTRTFVHPTLGDKYAEVVATPGASKFPDPFTVWEMLDKAGFVPKTAKRAAVQIGGGKLGTLVDSTHKFVHKGWAALIMDAAPGFEADFRQNFPGPKDKVTLVERKLELATSGNVLKDNPAFLDASYFQVDFDSWDCELVERWFEWFPTFRPFMVQLEVAYWMVPPIKFSVLYSDDSYATFSANYKSLYAGCSLTLQEELMRRYGYVLVQMDYLDALYVKREALPFFQGLPFHPSDVWRVGFLERGKYDPVKADWVAANMNYYLDNVKEVAEKYRAGDCRTNGLLAFYWNYLVTHLGSALVHSPFVLGCGSDD